MSLTRKHYNELAEIIRDNLIEFNSLEGKIIFGDYFKTQLLSFLKRDNRNFQKDLFLEASGLDSHWRSSKILLLILNSLSTSLTH